MTFAEINRKSPEGRLLAMAITVLLAFTLIAAVAFAADPAPATPASVGFLDWFKQNTTLVLGVALAISELMAQIPAFKGNGIIDTIIKALKTLSDKDGPPVV